MDSGYPGVKTGWCMSFFGFGNILFLNLDAGYYFSFHTKLLQTWLFNTIEMYLSKFWKPEVRTQGLSRASFPEGSRGQSTSCLFQLLVLLAVPCGWISPFSASVFMWPCLPCLSSLLSLIWTLAMGFRVRLGSRTISSQNLLSIISTKTSFQTRSYSQASREHHSTHYSYPGVKF